MLKNYCKIAWRNLISNKSTTAINILGLAIGISACLIIWLATHFELSYDTFHPDKELIYRVVSNIDNPDGRKNYSSQVPYAAALTIRREFTGIEKTANFFSYSARVTVPEAGKEAEKGAKKFEENYPSETIIPESSYFDIFSYQWLEGNAATALDHPFQVVLTESRARLYFGSEPLGKIIGRELIYGDSLHLTVSGIVKDWTRHSDLLFKEFISFSTIQSSFLKNVSDLQMATRPTWNMPDYTQNFVKLAKGTTPAQFEQQTLGMVKEHMTHKDDRGKIRITLQPLSAIHFDSNYRDFYSRKVHLPTLYILMGIAAFILFIATINFINLSTAQSMRRAKEIGIRKVLGSNRSSLVLQFLVETFLLTCLAVVLSLLITNIALRIFQDFIPQGLGLDLADSFTWIFLLCTILVTSLLAGFYPALVLSSYLPIRTLQARGRARQKGYLRKGLIVFQFTISLVFIIGTIVIGSQTHYLLSKDMGFKKDAIIGIETSNDYATNKRNILAEKIRQLPGVGMVSACWTPPMINYNHPEGRVLQLKDKPTKIECSERMGDEYYVPIFGLKIIAGQNFKAPHDDTVGFIPSRVPYGYSLPPKQAEILINETCARQLGFKSPEEAIGHFAGTTYPEISGPIVGVVADFHSQSLFSPVTPTYLYGTKNLWRGGVQVKLTMQNKSAAQFKTTLAAIEKSWKEIFPEEKFEYRFLDESIAGFYDKEQKTARITNAAMIIAIFISCMGLFGLVTFTAEQRTREIGIRKVLGASVSGIVAMLSKDFLLLVILSILIASPIAWYFLHQWLQNFAYRITISWWIYVLAGLSAILAALITVSFRAIKAAIANPVKSLKME
ncbi:MAG TPA: FtsX-like permease family protein [Puia sp.]|nr:FtsX-like permease family protein [Puia sp.]